MAVESGGGGDGKLFNSDQTGDIHVFDFKYNTGETQESLQYIITNEIVKYLGNPVYCTKNESGSEKKDARNRGSSVDIRHRLLDVNKGEDNVLQTALNKTNICVLLDNGSVLRASCSSCHTNSTEDGVSSPIRHTEQVTSDPYVSEEQAFQTDNDAEAYARSLQRTINTLSDTVNLLAGRRSYNSGSISGGRSPIIHQSMVTEVPSCARMHGIPVGVSTSLGTAQLLPNPRELLSGNTSIVFNPALHQLSPTLRSARYLPYNRDYRHRRLMPMRHSLDISSSSRTMMYSTSVDEDMTESSFNILAGDSVIVPVVSIDNDQSDASTDMDISNFQNIDSPVTIQQLNDGFQSETIDSQEPGSNIALASVVSPSDINSNSNDSVGNNEKAQKYESTLEEGSLNSQILSSLRVKLTQSSEETRDKYKSKKDKNLWVPEFGQFQKSSLMEQIVSIYGIKSAFLLVDVNGVLWSWPNDELEPTKVKFEWNGKEKIIAVGCNSFRVSLFFESRQCTTFYDKCFEEMNHGKHPTLIKTLSHAPQLFNELKGEDIADVKCSTFFTVVQTVSGKVYWWGLAPSSERNSSNISNKSNTQENFELVVGDVVSLLKQNTNENGALVFNIVEDCFGVVMRQLHHEDAARQFASNKIVVKCLDENNDNNLKSLTEIWDLKDIVYLHEQSTFAGKVVSLDGPYAIVQHSEQFELATDQSNYVPGQNQEHNDSTSEHNKSVLEQEKWKVYYKSSLEKIMVDENSSKVGRNRYHKYLTSKLIQVFDDSNFLISAISISELGINLLVNRKHDDKSFLVYPKCLNNHYSKWFTCSKTEIEVNENIKSECCVTVECESTPSYESNLDIITNDHRRKTSENNIFHNKDENMFDCSPLMEETLEKANSVTEIDYLLQKKVVGSKFMRSMSLPTGSNDAKNGKRKFNTFEKHFEQESPKKISKPQLHTTGSSTNQLTLLIDNVGCLYPVRFICCLSNPPLLEILPMKSFILFDRGCGQGKDDKILTVIAVPKSSPLISAIKNANKAHFDDLIGGDKKETKRTKVDDEVRQRGNMVDCDGDEAILNMLDEKCNGNQNVIHVAGNNIIKTAVRSAPYGNIMDIRSVEENAMLQKLLDTVSLWPKVRKLLCERDSHGCTPFMNAIVMQNLCGAYLILEAVKQDCKSGSSDQSLLHKAIFTPTFCGVTPFHALVHSSSKKQSSQEWYNTLKVTNLPPSYSARLLLRLFKSRYPSVHRAITPIPKPSWSPRTIRGKGKADKKLSPERLNKRGKVKMHVLAPLTRRTYMYGGSVPPNSRNVSAGGRHFPNRETTRPNAKEGLVMFGNINEMHQALTEMNNHVLLSKADHPSGALLSVVQHVLQLQQYQEFPNDQAIGSPLNCVYYPIYYPKVVGCVEGNGGGGGSSSSSSGNVLKSQENVSDASHNREETISKCFDDIMVHVLLTSLTSANSSISSSANAEGASALSYFIKTYPRYSPSHLHKLFLNWRPCNPTNCKYNRHIGKLSITCQSNTEIATQNNQEKKKTTKEENKGTTFLDVPSAGACSENPILARRGLQGRTNSLMLNVNGNTASDILSSPITPNIRIIDNLKFAPIEVNMNTGLTPQISHPLSEVDAVKESTLRKGFNCSPFFPQTFGDQSKNVHSGVNKSKQVDKSKQTDESVICMCHLSKARLLWNTTFEASVFFLAKNWPCLVATVMCYLPLSKTGRENLKLVDSNKLDSFTENILINPYNILLEVFIKTLIEKFLESKVSQNAALLSSLHPQNPTNSSIFKEKTFNTLLPWLTLHRFVRSLVRQLSLSVSKSTISDVNLKYKIGRYLNKNHSKKEVRMKENLSLCLKAFSWISVLEILRAADAILKPIRSGTVKAQVKGIIRDIHNAGPSSVVMGRAHTNMRTHPPPPGPVSSQRSVMRNASRKSTCSVPQVPSTATSMLLKSQNEATNASLREEEEDSTSDSDENSHLEDPFLTNPTQAHFERIDSDLNEVDWNQSQGITPSSSVAWAVDGHIRVRNEVSNRLLPPPALWQFNHQNQLHQQIMNTPSVHAGYLYLARMFCRLVKEATDLANVLHSNNGQGYGPSSGVFEVQPLGLTEEVENILIKDANDLLVDSWQWMKNILNSLEEQLKVGENFDTKHFVLRLKKGNQENEMVSLGRPSLTHMYGSNPDEYMMYLLKQDMGEAEDSLPVLDLFSYTHMTYVLDAYLYINKLNPFSVKQKGEKRKESVTESVEPDSLNSTFYKQMLKVKNYQEKKLTEEMIVELQRHVEFQSSIANHISSWLDESIVKKQKSNDSKAPIKDDTKWNRVIDAFTTLFLSEGPGYERDSFLAVKAGASGRISRFQQSLSSVRGTSFTTRPYYMVSTHPENPALLINVVRSKLLEDCINIFSENTSSHPFGSLRVRFEGEEGTGPGVNRGLFAAFANALKSGQQYKDWPVQFFAECGNLPAQHGIFSPIVGKYHCIQPPNVYFGYPMTQEKRYSAFVAIGRFIGLSLWFNQTIPLILCRPVLQYLLGKDEGIVFDDLAYFDSALYSSFSRLMADALSSQYTDDEFMELYNFCFEISVDGHIEELVPDGRQIHVTTDNALKYIRLYTRHHVFTSRENELQGLRDGLQQMIPKELLDNLEPEDLQLLLSGGVEDVNFTRLQSIISFSNSRGCSRDILERYKSWFWKIVRQMSSSERQKLLYFATGSSVLPALDNRVGNNEELAITVDIINSSNSSALPMSSTCGQRISMPLYSTKAILKQKLLQAVECQSYGLG